MKLRTIAAVVLSLLALGFFLIAVIWHFGIPAYDVEEGTVSFDRPDVPDIAQDFVQEVQDEVAKHKFITMLHYGDMMLDRNVANVMGSEGLPVVLEEYVEAEKSLFESADIIAANLEGAVVQHRIATTKEIAFRFAPTLMQQMADYGFNLVTLANNHTLDMGHRGVDETYEHLREAGIEYYGHQTRINASSTLYKEIEGVKFAFVGINDTHPGTDIATTLDLIEEAEGEADITIVNVHWGAEYKELSHTRQRDLAYQFVDAGADMIIGHHPHVVQEMEIYKNRAIFYSLGNFIFDQYFSVPTQQSLGLHLVFHNTDGVSIRLLPLKGERSVVKHMGDEEAEVMEAFFERSRLGEHEFDSKYRLYLPYDN